MKLFVLYDKSGIHSGRMLGRHLIQKLHGKATVQRGRPKRLKELLARGNRYDYIINVGWYRSFDSGGAVILNPPESISLSSNKRKARVRFKQRKVPAPNVWLNPDSVHERNLPVIGRTTHHSKGKGLWICNSLLQVRQAAQQGATHFLKLIPNTREFRVHVMAPRPNLGELKDNDFRVIKLSEKLPNPSARHNEIVKNHENGWIFGYPTNREDPVLPRLREVARQAILPFGLHWGAVDIMLSKDTGEPFVLEINSTPCLTDDSANTLEKYANAICEMVGIVPRKVKRVRPRARPAEQKSEPKKKSNKFISFLKRSRL